MTWKESKRVRALLEDPVKRKLIIAATKGLEYGQSVDIPGVGRLVKVSWFSSGAK